MNLRLSDEERNSAIAALGRAFAEGRLSMSEYDERCQQVAMAITKQELDPIFSDIPYLPATTQQEETPVFTAQEILQAHQQSKKTRAGIMGLTTIGSLASSIFLTGMFTSGGPFLLLLLIPTMWILLYLMKVGPAEWYTPSPKALYKQRVREIESAEAMRNAEIHVQNKEQRSLRRAERQRIAGELTNEAMHFAKRSLGKFKN